MQQDRYNECYLHLVLPCLKIYLLLSGRIRIRLRMRLALFTISSENWSYYEGRTPLIRYFSTYVNAFYSHGSTCVLNLKRTGGPIFRLFPKVEVFRVQSTLNSEVFGCDNFCIKVIFRDEK